MPTVIADTRFFPGEVAVTVIWTAAIGFTVRNITRFALPVFITLTVHLAWNRDAGCTLPMARAIVRTRIDSVKRRAYTFKFKKTEQELWLVFL